MAKQNAASAGDTSPPSAPSPDPADTEVMDAVNEQPTETMDAVEAGDTQAMDPVADDSAAEDAEAPEAIEEPARDRNWMGYASFVASALMLSIVGIVLGHLGLSAAKSGRAGNRSFSVAGLILGYLGLVLTLAAAGFLSMDRTTPEDIDIEAQQDVSALGAAAATDATATGDVPVVEQTESGYTVNGAPFEAHLSTAHTLTFTGSEAADWCLEIAYEGGEQPAFSYVATAGMAPGGCPG